MSPDAKESKKIYQEFAREIEILYPKAVVSVVAYGSSQSGEFRPGDSDLNVLVVLDETAIGDLSAAASKHAHWAKRGIRQPLILSPSYIENSRDTFPVELFNISSAYEVLRGIDPFEGLVLDRGHMRLQIERELKGMLLHLRQGFLASGLKGNLLRELAYRSAKDLRFIFRALASLLELEPGTGDEPLVRSVCDHFGVASQPILTLFRRARGKSKDKPSWVILLGGYIESVRALGRAVDAMTS